MSYNPRISICEQHSNELLDELERNREFEVLRKYLIKYNLFPRKKDPNTAPIRYEELKELAKYWKLHRQRNFWRNNADKEELVKTLNNYINTNLEKINSNENISSLEKINENSNENFMDNMGNQERKRFSITSPSQPYPSANAIRRLSNAINPENNGSIRSRSKTLKEYRGDLFGQRGDYQDAMIYLSRLGMDAIRKTPVTIISQHSNNQLLNEDIKGSIQSSENTNEIDFNDNTNNILENDKKHSKRSDYEVYLREKKMKCECACSLYNLTLEEGSEPTIISEGGVEAIIKLVAIDDIDTKRYSSASIANLMCNLKLCQKMLDKGILSALVELAKFSNEEIHRNVSISLCRISYEKNGQSKLVSEGGITAMLTMLNSSDYKTLEACIKALINIDSSTPTSSDSVVHAINRIASLESSVNDNEHIKFLTSAILNLSVLSSTRAKSVEDGILDSVLSIVSISDNIEKNEKNISDALYLDILSSKMILSMGISNFATVHSSHDKLGNIQLLKSTEYLLVSTSRKPQNVIDTKYQKIRSKIIEICMFEFRNLSCSLRALQNMIKENFIIKLILSLCVDLDDIRCKNTVEGIEDTVLSIQESIASILLNLTVNAEIKEKIECRNDAFKLLTQLVQQGNVATKRDSVKAICNFMLETNPWIKEVILQNNFINILLDLARSNDDSVRNICALSFYNISCNKILQDILLSDEIIQLLINLASLPVVQSNINIPINNNSKEISTQEHCLGTLYNLSFREDECKLMIKHGVIHMLDKLFDFTQCFSVPSTSENGSPSINTKYIVYANTIVCNLTFLSTDCLQQLINDGIIKYMAKQIRYNVKLDIENIFHLFSTTLCNLSEIDFEEIRDDTSSTGLNKKMDVISEVVSLLILVFNHDPGSPSVVSTCAIAFSRLSCKRFQRAKLIQNIELPTTLTLMMRSGVEDVQINAAVTLCNLACEKSLASISGTLDKKSVTANSNIWKSETVSGFIVNSLLRVNSIKTKCICARALFNLLTHEENRPQHIENGVLYALVKLSRLEELEIREISVIALHNLSCDSKVTEMLINMDIIQVIAKLCENAELSTTNIRKYLSKCLTNISKKSIHIDKMINGGILQAIISLSAMSLAMIKQTTDSTELNDSEIICLANCSYIASRLSLNLNACEAIVSSALLDITYKWVQMDTNQTSHDIPFNAFNMLCNASTISKLHGRLEETNIIKNVLGFISQTRNSGQIKSFIIVSRIIHNLLYSKQFVFLLAKSKALLMFYHVIRTLFKKPKQNEKLPLAIDQEKQINDACIANFLETISRIILILSEDKHYRYEFAAEGGIECLMLICQNKDFLSISVCLDNLMTLSLLVRDNGTCLSILNNDGIGIIGNIMDRITALNEANYSSSEVQDEQQKKWSYFCTVILRSISSFYDCRRILGRDERVFSYILRLSNICMLANKEDKKGDVNSEGVSNIIYTLYNITLSCKEYLSKLVENKIVTLLIDLSRFSHNLAMKNICGIILSRINSQILPNEIKVEGGLVTTISYTLNADNTSVEELDKNSTLLPSELTNPNRPDSSNWKFQNETNSPLYIETDNDNNDLVDWCVKETSIDQIQSSVIHPSSYLASLQLSTPTHMLYIKDILYGSFNIMEVKADKIITNKMPITPMLLPRKRSNTETAKYILDIINNGSQVILESSEDKKMVSIGNEEVREPTIPNSNNRPILKRQLTNPISMQSAQRPAMLTKPDTKKQTNKSIDGNFVLPKIT